VEGGDRLLGLKTRPDTRLQGRCCHEPDCPMFSVPGRCRFTALQRASAECRVHLCRRPRLRRPGLLWGFAGQDSRRSDRLASRAAVHGCPLRRRHLHAVAILPADRRIRLAAKRYGSPARRRPADHRAGRTTLASVFKKAGYTTGAVGKWHLGSATRNSTGTARSSRTARDRLRLLLSDPRDGRPRALRVRGEPPSRRSRPSDPIKVSYAAPVGSEPTGKANPELLKVHPSHGHDQTIVNGISRIGYMSGGKSARWVDEDMADTITDKAVAFIERSKRSRSSCISPRTTCTCPAFRHPRFAGKSLMGHARRHHAVRRLRGPDPGCPRSPEAERETLVIVSSDNGHGGG